MSEKEEKIRVLELICSQVESSKDDLLEGLISEDDFKDLGMSFFAGKIIFRKLYEEGILSFNDNDFTEEVDYRSISFVTAPKVIDSYLESLKNDEKEKVKELEFDTNKGVLKINDFEIEVSEKREKTYGHYVLEHIFENQDDINERAYYTDINDKYFQDEKKGPKTFYDACVAINNKVMRVASIANFLDFSASKDGSVRINPDYLE